MSFVPQSETGFIKLVDLIRSGRTRMRGMGILIAAVSFGTAIGYVKLPSPVGSVWLGLGIVSVALLIWGSSERTIPREELIKSWASPMQIVVLCLLTLLLFVFAYGQRWSWVTVMTAMTTLHVWLRIKAVKWQTDHSKKVGAVHPEP